MRDFIKLSLVGLSFFLVTACGGSNSGNVHANETANSSSPAQVVEASVAGEDAQKAITEIDSVESTDAVDEDHGHEESPAHKDDDADNHADHDHDASDHDDHDAHEAYDDHDSHSDHKGHGGSLSKHVHGEGQLVIVKTAEGFSANFIAPLASVGLASSLTDPDKIPNKIAYEWLKPNNSARCKRDVEQGYTDIERLGDHGNVDFDVSFVCEKPDQLKTVEITLFDMTDALEKVDALITHDGEQTAQTLTKQNHALTVH